MVDPPSSREKARWVLAMLERLSADSMYAHKASGLRGSILRLLETGYDEEDLLRLIEAGFSILEKAAGELRGLEDIREQLRQMKSPGSQQ